MPTFGVASVDYLGIPAIAFEQPFWVARRAALSRYGGEHSISYTGGNRFILGISHCLVSFKALVRGLPVGAGSSRHFTTMGLVK